MSDLSSLIVRFPGRLDYQPVWQAMRRFTDQRGEETADEIWLLEHNPVFTQGQAGKAEHVLGPGDIPVVQTDRGGQVTYHGPGQITGYVLVDLKRLGINVRQLVSCLERAMLNVLEHWRIEGVARADAPGVYVAGRKIGSLGLRVRKGRSYHGLNFNVNMDMEPWRRINPCGLGIPVTQLREILHPVPPLSEVAGYLADQLAKGLGYNDYSVADPPAIASELLTADAS